MCSSIHKSDEARGSAPARAVGRSGAARALVLPRPWHSPTHPLPRELREGALVSPPVQEERVARPAPHVAQPQGQGALAHREPRRHLATCGASHKKANVQDTIHAVSYLVLDAGCSPASLPWDYLISLSSPPTFASTARPCYGGHDDALLPRQARDAGQGAGAGANIPAVCARPTTRRSAPSRDRAPGPWVLKRHLAGGGHRHPPHQGRARAGAEPRHAGVMSAATQPAREVRPRRHLPRRQHRLRRAGPLRLRERVTGARPSTHPTTAPSPGGGGASAVRGLSGRSSTSTRSFCAPWACARCLAHQLIVQKDAEGGIYFLDMFRARRGRAHRRELVEAGRGISPRAEWGRRSSPRAVRSTT